MLEPITCQPKSQSPPLSFTLSDARLTGTGAECNLKSNQMQSHQQSATLHKTLFLAVWDPPLFLFLSLPPSLLFLWTWGVAPGFSHFPVQASLRASYIEFSTENWIPWELLSARGLNRGSIARRPVQSLVGAWPIPLLTFKDVTWKLVQAFFVFGTQYLMFEDLHIQKSTKERP